MTHLEYYKITMKLIAETIAHLICVIPATVIAMIHPPFAMVLGPYQHDLVERLKEHLETGKRIVADDRRKKALADRRQ